MKILLYFAKFYNFYILFFYLFRNSNNLLFNYIKMDMDEFCKTFITNFLSYQKLISENLKANEFIDTRPDIVFP